jgi:hypothetical protein
MSNEKHTPTPWYVIERGGEIIIAGQAPEAGHGETHVAVMAHETLELNRIDAMRIKRAVDAHDALVSALARALPVLAMHAPVAEAQARESLALAEGK